MRAAALALGTVFLLTWASPEATRAEGFIDLYIGGAVTQDTDITAKIGPAGGVPQFTSSGSVDFGLHF